MGSQGQSTGFKCCYTFIVCLETICFIFSSGIHLNFKNNIFNVIVVCIQNLDFIAGIFPEFYGLGWSVNFCCGFDYLDIGCCPFHIIEKYFNFVL